MDKKPFNEKQRIERIRNLNLEDNVFFNEVVKHPEACGDIIRIILNKPKLIIERVESQYSISNVFNRSLVLDVLASDGKNHFNVEIQKSDDDDHVRRVRYHQGAIDTHTFAKSTKFYELPILYIIFITKKRFSFTG